MRKSIFFILLAIATTILHAQSNTGDNIARLINEGRRLHAEGEYTTALNILSKIDTRALSSAEQQEIDFLRATATFGTGHMEGRAMLHQYLADYPETNRRDIISALIAESYYYSHNFELANKWFKEADFARLDTYERERAELHYALTLQECGEEEAARNRLTTLCLTGKKYTEDAQFHLAAALYHNNELQQAYEGFKKVEMSDKYYLEVPYYIAGIYTKQGNYSQAEQVAEAFIADHGKKPQGVAMNQMLGAALFGQERYAEAIVPLETYLNNISGTPERPRLCVYRSLANINAQIIDDVNGVTLASASTLEKAFEGNGGNKEAAKKIGLAIAERALAKGITEVVFDRGGYVYQGRVKELADGAREGGLKF